MRGSYRSDARMELRHAQASLLDRLLGREDTDFLLQGVDLFNDQTCLDDKRVDPSDAERRLDDKQVDPSDAERRLGDKHALPPSKHRPPQTKKHLLRKSHATPPHSCR